MSLHRLYVGTYNVCSYNWLLFFPPPHWKYFLQTTCEDKFVSFCFILMFSFGGRGRVCTNLAKTQPRSQKSNLDVCLHLQTGGKYLPQKLKKKSTKRDIWNIYFVKKPTCPCPPKHIHNENFFLPHWSCKQHRNRSKNAREYIWKNGKFPFVLWVHSAWLWLKSCHLCDVVRLLTQKCLDSSPVYNRSHKFYSDNDKIWQV